jgi:hypothetical protein
LFSLFWFWTFFSLSLFCFLFRRPSFFTLANHVYPYFH